MCHKSSQMNRAWTDAWGSQKWYGKRGQSQHEQLCWAKVCIQENKGLMKAKDQMSLFGVNKICRTLKHQPLFICPVTMRKIQLSLSHGWKKKWILKEVKGWVWWHAPIISALGRLRQEDHGFEASLSYKVRPYVQQEHGPELYNLLKVQNPSGCEAHSFCQTTQFISRS